MKKTILIIMLLHYVFSTAFGQGIQPPAAGNSVVYFVRESALGLVINFSFFDNDKFIGKFDGGDYLRYECSPGEHLFWAKAENRDFITADLEPDKIYFVDVIPQMGMVKASVQIHPVKPDDDKTLKGIFKLINKKAPVTYPPEELEAENERLQEAISKGLAKYQEELGSGVVFKKLEKNMWYRYM
jgi:hypothetical protein